MNTVAPTTTTVKTSDEQTVSVAKGTLEIRYGGHLLTAMNLEDAINVAKMVLTYAVTTGISIGDATADLDALSEEDWVELQAQMREDYQAMVDNALERYD